MRGPLASGPPTVGRVVCLGDSVCTPRGPGGQRGARPTPGFASCRDVFQGPVRVWQVWTAAVTPVAAPGASRRPAVLWPPLWKDCPGALRAPLLHTARAAWRAASGQRRASPLRLLARPRMARRDWAAAERGAGAFPKCCLACHVRSASASLRRSRTGAEELLRTAGPQSGRGSRRRRRRPQTWSRHFVLSQQLAGRVGAGSRGASRPARPPPPRTVVVRPCSSHRGLGSRARLVPATLQVTVTFHREHVVSRVGGRLGALAVHPPSPLGDK